MTKQQGEIYSRMYSELFPLAHKLDEYYDIDKIKSFGIYVWDKPTNECALFPDTENIFDIYADQIKIWRPCSIIPESLPIIAEIIRHLKKMEKYRKECENGTQI